MRWAHIFRDHCCTPLGVQYTDEPEEVVAAQAKYESTLSDYDDAADDDDHFTDVRILCALCALLTFSTILNGECFSRNRNIQESFYFKLQEVL